MPAELTAETGDSDERSLSDFPADVVGLIIEESDYKEQLILRKVSPTLRSLVDKHKPSCKSISVEIGCEHVFCQYNHQKVIYKKTGYIRSDIVKNHPDAHVIHDDKFKKIALNDLEWTLKNPKLQLEKLKIDQIGRPFQKEEGRRERINGKYNCIENILKSLGHQLSTKSCDFEAKYPNHLLSFIPYLKPGFLENIIIRRPFGWERDELSGATECLNKLAALEQWKQAKELGLHYFLHDFPLEHANHFKRLYFKNVQTDDKKVALLKNHLRSKVNTFEQCILEVDSNYGAKYNQLFTEKPEDCRMSLARPNNTPPNELICLSHWSIPDSDYGLELQFYEERTVIQKKKKELMRKPF